MVEQDGSVMVNAIPVADSESPDGRDDTSRSVATEKFLVLHPGQHFRRYFFGNEHFTGDATTSSPVTRGSIYQSSAF